MPIAFPADALQEFRLLTDELEDSLRAAGTVVDVQKRLGSVEWESLGKNARQLLGYISKNKNIDVTPIYRGLLVALAGAFEHFVRRLIRDAITFYNERVTRFDDVPEKLRHQNILRTGKALATIAQPFDHWPVNYEQVGKNIATCTAGATGFVLNADAFTGAVSNLTSPQLETILEQRLGFTLNWDDVGRVIPMQKLLGKVDTNTTANAAKAELQAFIKLRNKIAHTGSGGVTISSPDLARLIAFFRLLATAMGSALRKHVDRL